MLKNILGTVFLYSTILSSSQIFCMGEQTEEIINSNDVIHFILFGDRDIPENTLSLQLKIDLIDRFTKQGKFIPALKVLWSEKNIDTKIKWLTQKAEEGYTPFMLELSYLLSLQKSLEEQKMSLNWYHTAYMMMTINIKCHYNSHEFYQAQDKVEKYFKMFLDTLETINFEDLPKENSKAFLWAYEKVKSMKNFQDPSWIGYSKNVLEVRLDLRRTSQNGIKDIQEEVISLAKQYMRELGINYKIHKHKAILKEIIRNFKRNSFVFKRSRDKALDLNFKKPNMKFETIDNID